MTNCTEVGGRIRIKGGRIELEDGVIESTLMGCDNYTPEEWISGLMRDRPHMALVAGRITLTAGDRRAEFAEQVDNAKAVLTGRRWVATRVIAGRGTGEAWEVAFKGDGSFTQGPPGCAQASGSRWPSSGARSGSRSGPPAPGRAPAAATLSGCGQAAGTATTCARPDPGGPLRSTPLRPIENTP